MLRRLTPALRRTALVVLVVAGAALGVRAWPGGDAGGVTRPLVDERTGGCRVLAVRPLLSPRALLFDRAFAGRPARADSAIDRWVGVFTGRFAPTMRTFLARAEGYREAVVDVLREHGIPEDFLYLAVIESGMDPHAVSRARAVGMWQFMDYTAREEGLAVTGLVDERRDPVAATRASARYLRSLYDELGDWALAAAAYNGGPWRVKRAIRRTGSRDYWTLVERRALPRETRQYVAKLIAAAHVGTDPGGTGLGLVAERPAPRGVSVMVEPASRLSGVARAAGVEEAAIARLNPHLVGGVTSPSVPSRVRIPREAVAGFHYRLGQLPREARLGTVTHVVARDETVARIASAYGVSVQSVMAANRVDPRRLPVGQPLIVPLAR